MDAFKFRSEAQLDARTQPKQPQTHSWLLHYGITFSIEHVKALSIDAIQNFLAIAMEHFKDLRDKQRVSVVEDQRWQNHAIQGRTIVGVGTLASPNPHFSSDAWVKAVVTAFSNAETLSQIREQLAAYKHKASADGWLAEVIVALEKPKGDAEAFGLMMKRERERPSL